MQDDLKWAIFFLLFSYFCRAGEGDSDEIPDQEESDEGGESASSEESEEAELAKAHSTKSKWSPVVFSQIIILFRRKSSNSSSSIKTPSPKKAKYC